MNSLVLWVVEGGALVLWQWKLLLIIMTVVLVKAEAAQKKACVFPLGFHQGNRFHIRYEESIIYIRKVTCKCRGEKRLKTS